MTSHLDTYAALTALFTTSDGADAPPACDDRTTPSIVVPPRPRIECLVPGHLPVRASVWFLPCAARLAGADNAGVLIQCEDELAQLTAFGTAGASGDRAALLEGFAQHARRWFLLPSNDADPGGYASLGVDRITILTGTDQAAVVAAYQTIKSIVAGCGPERGELDLGLFIAGSTESAAVEAAERLADTTQQQLGCTLQLRGSMHQLEAVDSALHREHVHLEGGAPRLVADIRQAITAVSSKPPAADPVPVVVPAPPVAPPLAVAEVAEPSPPSIETPVDHSLSEPTVDFESVEDPPTDELVACVEGLTALPVRCPHHASIELAVDAGGVVQVLGMIEELPALLAVQAWAGSHGALLALACRECSIRAEASPEVHVFAESADVLAPLHGTSLRLHVLMTVEIGPHRTRHATALS